MTESVSENVPRLSPKQVKKAKLDRLKADLDRYASRLAGKSHDLSDRWNRERMEGALAFRARKRLLRDLRDAPVEAIVPDETVPPVLPPATKFKGDKRLRDLETEARPQANGIDTTDPVFLLAQRRGLLPDEYLDQDTARRKLRQNGWAREQELPKAWTGDHVGKRLVEAFQTLLRMPGQVTPREFGNSMPAYLREWSDMVGWIELPRTHMPRLGVTTAQLVRMEEALGWLQFIRDDLVIAKAVGLAALWEAQRRRVRRELRQMNLPAATFYKRRRTGLYAIAVRLVHEGVRVA